MIPDTVKVPLERYEQLLDAERKLAALEASGVDNWDGYDEAMRDYYGTANDTT